MNDEVKKAALLAAGEGTRLRPLTLETPKVLLTVGGRPLIEYTLAWLKNHGIREVAINLHHLGEKIRQFLGDGSRFGMKVFYSPEETLLGTAGGVKRMEHFFDSTFVMAYGDVLTDFDLSAMIRFHQAKNSLVTLVIREVVNPWEVGMVKIDEESRILSFVEKPPRGSRLGNLGTGGIYILEKEALNHIPGGAFSDLSYDIFPKLIELNLPIYGYVLKPDDYLTDIGTIEKYQKANEDIKAGKVKIRYGEQSRISG